MSKDIITKVPIYISVIIMGGGVLAIMLVTNLKQMRSERLKEGYIQIKSQTRTIIYI